MFFPSARAFTWIPCWIELLSCIISVVTHTENILLYVHYVTSNITCEPPQHGTVCTIKAVSNESTLHRAKKWCCLSPFKLWLFWWLHVSFRGCNHWYGRSPPTTLARLGLVMSLRRTTDIRWNATIETATFEIQKKTTEHDWSITGGN